MGGAAGLLLGNRRLLLGNKQLRTGGTAVKAQAGPPSSCQV